MLAKSRGLTMSKNGIGAPAILAFVVLAVCAFLFMALGVSINSGTDGEIVVPSGSPVWFSYGSKYDGGAADVFIGDIILSGTYYYGYEIAGGEVAAFIVPDDASAKVLPHWKRWGPVKRIDLSNPDDFAKAALSQDSDSQITGRKQFMTHGHIVIVVSDFEVAGECDQPVYLAKFKSVYRPKDMIASKENTVTNCG
jgi:hypothetical protein